jgi:hypothetical protein
MTAPARFHQHFDYGLLREQPAGSLHFEAWLPTEQTAGLWHTVELDPFTASMSQLEESEAREIAGEHLYDLADDERYQQVTRANLAKHGL